MAFEKLRFQNVFRPHVNEKPAFSNSPGLKSVFEKLRFQISPVLGGRWLNYIVHSEKKYVIQLGDLSF